MPGTFRTFGFLLVFGVSVALVSCDDDDDTTGPHDGVDNNDYVAEEEFRYAFEVVDHATFRIEGINGDVDVQGLSGSDSIVVAGTRQVGSETMEDAEEHLQYLDVIVEDMGTEVHARTDQPEQTGGRSYTVDYSVCVPKTLKVIASNVNGVITIESLNRDAIALDTNGAIALEGIYGSATATLVNGTIEGEVALPLGGIVVMAVTNGHVDLAIPQTTSAQFSANVAIGTITVSNLDFHNLVSTPTSLTGTLGSGEGTITLSTVNGNIVVTGI